MENVLEVNNLSKRFGNKTAVDNISFDVGKGQVFGLLGPNGSGKTTTLGVILTLLHANNGQVKLFNTTDYLKIKSRLGVLLESASYYPSLSAYRNLQISCSIKGIKRSEIDNALEKVGLTKEKNNKVKTFSLGMKQRLSVASALVGNPDFLIFDEPTNGLDPQGIADMRKLLTDLAKEGKTILIASHLLNEMERVCSHIAIMKNGKILESGVLSEITKGTTNLEEYFLKITS